MVFVCVAICRIELAEYNNARDRAALCERSPQLRGRGRRASLNTEHCALLYVTATTAIRYRASRRVVSPGGQSLPLPREGSLTSDLSRGSWIPRATVLTFSRSWLQTVYRSCSFSLTAIYGGFNNYISLFVFNVYVVNTQLILQPPEINTHYKF